MNKNQRNMLCDLLDCTKRVQDVEMMISFGAQWRRTASSLERLGYVDCTRSGWKVTPEGRRAHNADHLPARRKVPA